MAHARLQRKDVGLHAITTQSAACSSMTPCTDGIPRAAPRVLMTLALMATHAVLVLLTCLCVWGLLSVLWVGHVWHHEQTSTTANREKT